MIDTILTRPEGKTLEFKRDLSSPKPMLKTLVAFANTAGGRLVIGVDDDKQVVGVEDPLEEEERLCNLIADSIAPRLVPNIELITVEGKTLLIAEVFLSGSRPHFLRAEGPETGVYVRLGSTNRQADRDHGVLRRFLSVCAVTSVAIMPRQIIYNLSFGDFRVELGPETRSHGSGSKDRAQRT